MFKRVLLCYDGSEAGRRALRRGAELAIALNSHASVLLILPDGVDDPYLAAGAMGTACIVDDTGGYRRMLDESVLWLRARGVDADGYLAHGNTLDQIAAHSKRLGADLIVLGHYPRPAGGFWWWSGTQRGSLAERANCCVLVAVDNPAPPPAGA